MAKSKAPPLTQVMEEIVIETAQQHHEMKKALRDQSGERPYGQKKLTPEQTLNRYRTEIRGDAVSAQQYIERERRRFGLPDKTLDGRTLIPRRTLKELTRLEERHRGEEDEND